MAYAAQTLRSMKVRHLVSHGIHTTCCCCCGTLVQISHVSDLMLKIVFNSQKSILYFWRRRHSTMLTKCSYFPFWALAQPFNCPIEFDRVFRLRIFTFSFNILYVSFLIKRIIYRGAPRPVRFYVYSFHTYTYTQLPLFVPSGFIFNAWIVIPCIARGDNGNSQFHCLEIQWTFRDRVFVWFNPTVQPPTTRCRNTFVRIAMHCNVFIELIKIGCRFIQCRK